MLRGLCDDTNCEELKRIDSGVTTSKIKAWEAKEKAKINNRTERRLAEIESKQNEKKIFLEAQSRHIEERAERTKNEKKLFLEAQAKQMEEQVERQKQREQERIKNEEAKTVQKIEGKKASIEAQKTKDTLKIDEKSAKYQATKSLPKSYDCLYKCT